MLGLSEMTHGLFVLVLKSLYNTEQFTFFLSVSFPACLPLRAAPVHVNTETLPFWMISSLWSLLILLDLPLPLPHVLHFLLILATWECWYFPPVLSSFFFTPVLHQHWCSSRPPHWDVRAVCLQSPSHLHKLGVELCHVFSLCTVYKMVRYDSDSWRTWTACGTKIWEGAAWVF